jgi:chromosome segregation ATPase
MTDEVKSELESRLKALEEEFNRLDEENKVLNRQISERRTRMVQIQGAATELNALLDPPKEVPVEEPPKKESKKK